MSRLGERPLAPGVGAAGQCEGCAASLVYTGGWRRMNGGERGKVMVGDMEGSPGCRHKFKRRPDGMLACKLCGFVKAPRRREPGSVIDVEPIYTQELDCSRGAEFVRKRRRVEDFISKILTWPGNRGY